jgi:hypothetical protein
MVVKQIEYDNRIFNYIPTELEGFVEELAEEMGTELCDIQPDLAGDRYLILTRNSGEGNLDVSTQYTRRPSARFVELRKPSEVDEYLENKADDLFKDTRNTPTHEKAHLEVYNDALDILIEGNKRTVLFYLDDVVNCDYVEKRLGADKIDRLVYNIMHTPAHIAIEAHSTQEAFEIVKRYIGL